MLEYTCSVCGNTYKKVRSEEDCIKELKEVWGDCSPDECDIVCDDCYQIIIKDKEQRDNNSKIVDRYFEEMDSHCRKIIDGIFASGKTKPVEINGVLVSGYDSMVKCIQKSFCDSFLNQVGKMVSVEDIALGDRMNFVED